MRLIEYGKALPKQAGEALLKFSREAKIPRREKNTIILPDLPTAVELFPLKKGAQFLCNIDGVDGAWFGGTDEAPFLSRVNDEAINTFFTEGENGFYNFLKPPDANMLERAFGVASIRQGDFFFTPIDIDRLLKLASYFRWSVAKQEKGESRLFGTRHSVKGSTCRIENSETWQLFAKGKVIAPDHAPITLGDFYNVDQAQGFYNEETAKKAD